MLRASVAFHAMMNNSPSTIGQIVAPKQATNGKQERELLNLVKIRIQNFWSREHSVH